MGINTNQINPNAFGYTPSFPEGSDGISSFLAGFKGAKAAGAAEGAAISDAAETGVEAPKRSFFNRFSEGVLNAPGIKARGADPFAKLKEQNFQQSLATKAVEMQGNELSNRIKLQMLTDTLEDQRTFGDFQDTVKADPSVLSTGELPAFKTPQYRMAASQQQLMYSRGLLMEKNKQIVINHQKGLAELAGVDPQAYATISAMEDVKGLPSPDAIKALSEAIVKTGAGAKAQSTFGKLIADRAAASEADRPLFDQQIAAMGAKEGISIQFDDQGRPIINYGPGATGIGKPTVAVQTRAQDKLLKYENSMELMTQLENKLRPEHVGVAGAAGEMLLDRTLAQFVPGAADTNRIQARTALIAAKEGLMREISDDPRFSNRDREEISRALPSSGVFESYPDAITRIQTVKGILANRGRVYSTGLGLKAPVWSMSKDEIRDAYQNQELTEDEAVSALKRFHAE